MNNKLHISKTDIKLFGVCGGLAEYFKINSNIIRLLVILFSLMFYTLPLIYMLCWFILPDDEEIKSFKKQI